MIMIMIRNKTQHIPNFSLTGAQQSAACKARELCSVYFAFAVPRGSPEEGKKQLLSQAFLPASFLLLFSPLNSDSQTKLGKEEVFRSILLAFLSPVTGPGQP